MITKAGRYWLIFFIFCVSGFTGLIYESVWSHYLKLFLGHAAYAQALVLIIFMGGMAFGAGLAAKRSHQLPNLLLMYAWVEGIIGLFGLAFHPVFDFVTQFSHASVLPHLSPTLAQTWKWTLSALLILPQSFLLGTTFPLLCSGLLRQANTTTGKTVSLLYFGNSIGASIGVIVSGFVLIRLLGLPGTIQFAGLINILLALLVLLISRDENASTRFQQTLATRSATPVVFLLAAFFTGMASFIYEISWIRMLSMVLGSSTHSFELMLSAFILGLAIGGLWIRSRIDQLNNIIEFAAGIQIMMGLFAISTIPLYNFTHEIMSLVMQSLARTDSGYLLFSLSGHLICLFVMLPATICAGMTFPLFTKILLDKGYGERSIGYIYSANTLGAIVGVVFTVYIGLPLIGMKNSVLIGGAIDILLGFCLLFIFVKSIRWQKSCVNLFVCLAVVLLAYHYTEIDKSRLVAGVYRYGKSSFDQIERILFHKDGKTASISVFRLQNDNVIISTNGKPDASIIMDTASDEPAVDEITMVMAAALPLALNPDIKTVANIGMGSGLTSHVLLEWPKLEQLDTIEIEAAMVEGARYFLPRVKNAYEDERSNIHIEDAKTYFSNEQKKYDLIISEPSNPWVSGTASLFTQQFYRDVKRHLQPNGILLQWLQIYELETRLLVSVVKALHEQFPYFDIYATDDADILIVARLQDHPNRLHDDVFLEDGLARELRHVGLNSTRDFQSRFIGNEQLLGRYIIDFPVRANSDYYPILDLNAERSRFMQQNARDFVQFRNMPLPLFALELPEIDSALHTHVSDARYHTFSRNSHAAMSIYNRFIHVPAGNSDETLDDKTKNTIYIILHPPADCSAPDYEAIWVDNLYQLITATLPYLQPTELKDIISASQNACGDSMSVTQYEWLVLFKALADRDIENARQIAEKLYIEPDRWQIEAQRFIFSVMLYGNISRNANAEARQLWNDETPRLYADTNLPFGMRVLESMIAD